MKKLLLLGGSAQQVTAIESAKKLGCYTILCDYLPENPGQYTADRYYPVSTTDKDSVLRVAEHEHVDGVLAYASDPAAPTAAYVAEHLGLPTSPYDSVEILCNKDRFRKFLSENGFFTPKAKGYSDTASALRDIERDRFGFPVIVKPVDSSGSKGVSRIDGTAGAEELLRYAMGFSRAGRIIVEQFVEKYGYQVAGDGLSVDGKLVFRCFGNDHFDAGCVNPFVPVSASFPYCMPAEVQDKIHGEIQRLLTLLHMGTGTYNFDIRIDSEQNVYLMEIAPRSGGNYIPQVIRYATGVDMVECCVRAALGQPVEAPPMAAAPAAGFWSYYAVHSHSDGILRQIAIDPEVKRRHVVEEHLTCQPGDRIHAFTGANTALGVLLMRFDSMEQMLDMMDDAEQWLSIVMEGDTK